MTIDRIYKTKKDIKRQKFVNLFNKNNYKARLILSLGSLCFALLIAAVIFGKPDNTISNNIHIAAIKTLKTSSVATLESQFKHVERHEVANAKATVIYIPQIHREPTSNASDATNDQAVIVQKEIYPILNTLVNQNNIKYVMDETDMYGPMPSAKLEKIKTGLTDEASYKSSLEKILSDYIKSGGSAQTADLIRKQSNIELDKFERNIYLTGSAAMLAAENNGAVVYGSQNPATIDEAKKELVNLVYLQDRINQLKGLKNSTTTSNNTNSASSVSNTLLSLLSNNVSSPSNILSPVISFANRSGNTELSTNTASAAKQLRDLTSKTNFEAYNENDTSATNSRNDNPYQNNTDVNALQSTYDTAYAKFMKLAKDQRSQEVSDNMVKMLTENNQKTGILVLGAQHKEQLIEDLNKQNVSVIVITPDSEYGTKS